MDLGAIFSGLMPKPQNASQSAQPNTPVNSDIPMSKDQPGSLMQQWNTFLGQPGNRAAVTQFGLQMLQPIGLGQSLSGQIGQAIGAAGDAKSRVAESKAKTDLMTAQAGYYSDRANGGTASMLVDQRQKDAAYRQFFLTALKNRDPLSLDDPLASWQKFQQEDPQGAAQWLEELNKVWLQTQGRPDADDGSGLPAAPTSLTGAVSPTPQAAPAGGKPLIAVGPGGKRIQYNYATKQWDPI